MDEATPDGTGQLARNILYFARVLRDAGLPVGPGSVLDAVEAVQMAGIGSREDFRIVLHAIFVRKHEQTLIFDQAFDLFWRKRGLLDKLIALMSPMAAPAAQQKSVAPAGATRVSQALMKRGDEKRDAPQTELDYRLTISDDEVLQRRDFAQMTAAEIDAAKAAIARMNLRDDLLRTRRHRPATRGRIDPRRSFRQSLRAGGGCIQLAFRAPRFRAPPIVAICDISGSMSDYTRIFLHFLHTLGEQRRNVFVFLFGTRLTNVSRALQHKDPDEALAACSQKVEDWSGGTRIATSLHRFNRDWSRRVLGRGATVLLFTDGLERDSGLDLARETERLHKSCRRLIWLNPLLRYDRFEARAQGIRAILPHVDEFRPVHNLTSIFDLVAALSQNGPAVETDPGLWLRKVA